MSRRERRARRVRAPSPLPGFVIFRSDGASRKASLRSPCKAGWGAGHWAADGSLVEVARGYLGEDVSNNVAEYEGLAAAMKRSLEVVPANSNVAFEVDSKIVAKQVQVMGPGKYACRTASLTPFFLECVRLGWALTARGINWLVRHIYREYNQICDAQANQAIDIGSAPWRQPN